MAFYIRKRKEGEGGPSCNCRAALHPLAVYRRSSHERLELTRPRAHTAALLSEGDVVATWVARISRCSKGTPMPFYSQVVREQSSALFIFHFR